MSEALGRDPLSGAEWFAVELDPASLEVVMLWRGITRMLW